MIHIEPITTDDAAPVMALLREAWHASAYVCESIDEQRTIEQMAQAIVCTDTRCLLKGGRDGKVEGIAWFALSEFLGLRPEAVGWTLYVTPAARGTSLARRLLSRVESWARNRGARRVHVHVDSRIADERAIGWLGRIGYERSGVSLVRPLAPQGA